ncbi:MAG: ABC transporter permease subunit [Lachnospiraceae bacterium]|nr:ABC transporter permease subunit [Lachnospiraceae bacterium]
MTQKGRKQKIRKAAAVLAAALVWIAIWQICAMLMARSYILPTPLETLRAMRDLIITPDFWTDAAVSLGRVTLGITASFLLGLAGAVLASRFAYIRMFLSGITSFFKATPVMSVIMFCLLFIVSGMVPVAVCFMMCFPVFYTNILQGFDSTPRELLEVTSLYTDDILPKYRYVMLPLSVDYIRASLSLGCGLAWKTVVAAEVLSSPRISMGYHLLLAKTYFEADQLFAWTIAIVVLSVLFTAAVRRLINWSVSNDSYL